MLFPVVGEARIVKIGRETSSSEVKPLKKSWPQDEISAHSNFNLYTAGKPVVSEQFVAVHYLDLDFKNSKVRGTDVSILAGPSRKLPKCHTVLCAFKSGHAT